MKIIVNYRRTHTHTHTHLAAVVVEHSGDVLFGESSGRVGDEEAGLPHSAVTHNHTLYALHDDL